MKKLLLVAALGGPAAAFAQMGGNFTGNIESTFQYLNPDSIIGATQPAQKGLLNTYANVFYTHGNFKAGMRLESYLPRIQGYPNRFDGTGIGMRYVGYANDYVDVTLGNFYEQFGSGMAFRAYEDRNLGYDNTVDGLRLILRPLPGIQLKGIYGQQRYSFVNGRVEKADGITRGADAEFNLNTLFPVIDSTGLSIVLGGSLVSKYQADNREDLVLPENVGAYGGRADLHYKGFSLYGEYIYKENDPSADNNYIYNPGHAALAHLGYTRKGLGILVSAKSVDNMSFRADRTKDLQDVFINYLPALNKTHTYNLVATLYPYATQPLGEIAYQADILYTIPRKKDSKFRKYDIPINFNVSTAYLPIRHTSRISPSDSTGIAYEGKPFDMSDSLLWRDINANITYKFNKKWYVIGSYFNISLNNNVAKVSGDPNSLGIINSHIAVAEVGYKITPKHNLRAEFQTLFTKKDKGDWATILLEYTISPSWFFSVMDQYNYGNPNSSQRLHYVIGAVGWIRDATRLTVMYGRQRAGLFCVGGVCRFVPASNGLTLSFTQSF
jgi:hypothetical protein